jgi:ATP-binding cassette, subfamily B, bacterial
MGSSSGWAGRARLAEHTRAFLRTRAERLRAFRALCVLWWQASPPLTAATGLLTLVRGLLPTGVILATGALVGAIPGAVAGGPDSAAAGHAVWALAALGVAFVAHGACETVAVYVQQALATRFILAVHDTLARAVSRPAGIAELEDPEIAGEINAVEEYSREGIYGEAVASLQQLVVTHLQGLAALLVLLGFRWWAPLVMLAGWLLMHQASVRAMAEASMSAHLQRGTGIRRARYLRALAVESPAAKEVRVFGLGDWLVGRYADAWLAAMPNIWRQCRVSGVATTLVGAGLLAAHVVVLGAMGWSAWRGDLSLAGLVVFAQAVLATQALGPHAHTQWQAGQALQGTGRLVDLAARLTGTGPAADGIRHPPTGLPGEPVEVQLRDVRFTHASRDAPTLDGLNLTIPAGQSMAIVGANGAGKTTLIKLLCGLYKPQAGEIVVDGTQDLAAARSRIGVIFQGFVRYQLSLRANVGFGSLAYLHDTDTLATALRDASAGDLATGLPGGWETVLARDYDQPDGDGDGDADSDRDRAGNGDRTGTPVRGTDLSGGQWQKVALARALMAVRGGAGLLVLDEPTAHLDVRAEAELFERFVEVTHGVTTILVSHRLSSVRHAERIVVVADGRIVEDGTHEELMAAGGRYASMYTLQAERFAQPATPGQRTERESSTDHVEASDRA